MPYHVRVTPRDRRTRSRDALALDKDATWIEAHIVEPRRRGIDIFIDGQMFSWDDVSKIHITETDQPSEQILPHIRARRRADSIPAPMSDMWYVAKEGRDVTERFISGPPGVSRSADADKAIAFASNRKAVMVIYGHDKQANTAMFDWLRAIGLEPREWNQMVGATGSASPYIGEVLDKALKEVQAVVAFFTPDEFVTANTTLGDQGAGRLQSRPNVLIEAGMALITHPTRTVLVVLGSLGLPSDLAGRHYVRLDHTDAAALNDLANRLGNAGCETDLSGTTWLDPARFPVRTRASGSRVVPDADADREEPGRPAGQLRERGDLAGQARADYEARQVDVVRDLRSNVITVSSPVGYSVDQLEIRLVSISNGTIKVRPFGPLRKVTGNDSFSSPRVLHQFWSPSAAPLGAPIVRFIDGHGNYYYQYNSYTKRFPSGTNWSEAAAALIAEASESE